MRHGQTTFNVEGRLPGQMEGVALTDEGRRQAYRAAVALSGVPLSAVVSSPLERALDTAKALAKGGALEIQLEPDLMDTDVGRWTGLKIDDVKKSDPSVDRFRRASRSAAGGRREPRPSADPRRRRRRAHPRHPELGNFVAVVAHADIVKVILAHYMRIHLDTTLRHMYIGNASISALAFHEDEKTPTTLAVNWSPAPEWLAPRPKEPAPSANRIEGEVTAENATSEMLPRRRASSRIPERDITTSTEERSLLCNPYSAIPPSRERAILMFDPRSPYQRRMWHYDSDHPLSVAQLIAYGSLDARTAALLWLLIEKHQSLIVSGPTDPTPGVGKTTTLNALLEFLPGGSTLVYTAGMYEDFSFKDQVTPETTCVLANEVSDHLRIYMWGRVARALLRLPEEGYAVATSCHADTIDDVMNMLLGDLRLTTADVRRLGVIVNIGLVGRVWPPKRRFLSVYFADPAEDADATAASTGAPSSRGAPAPRPNLLCLASWDPTTDTQVCATDETLTRLAGALGMERTAFDAALARREAILTEQAQGKGSSPRVFRAVVEALQVEEAVSGQPDQDPA